MGGVAFNGSQLWFFTARSARSACLDQLTNFDDATGCIYTTDEVVSVAPVTSVGDNGCHVELCFRFFFVSCMHVLVE